MLEENCFYKQLQDAVESANLVDMDDYKTATEQVKVIQALTDHYLESRKEQLLPAHIEEKAGKITSKLGCFQRTILTKDLNEPAYNNHRDASQIN